MWYSKRDDNISQRGPVSVIGSDGQQVLVKHGSNYIKVHPCNVQWKSYNIATTGLSTSDNKKKAHWIHSKYVAQ